MPSDLKKTIPRRHFDKARTLARSYTIVVEPDERVGFLGRALEMPGVMGRGDDEGACAADVRDSLAIAIAVLLSKGEAPPPAGIRHRTCQLNIRVTPEERERLRRMAKANNQSLSGFMLSAALRATS